MKFDKFKFKLDRYMYENYTFRIVTLIMAGIIVFEGYLISDKVNNQKVVIMPPKTITKEFWVSGNRVSKSYLEQMGMFVVYNLMNIDKHTADYTIEAILPLVKPEFYYKVKAMLMEQIKYIIDNDISRVFYPSVIKTDKKGKIVILGITKDIIGNNVVAKKQQQITISYKIKQGRFWITGIVVEKPKRT